MEHEASGETTRIELVPPRVFSGSLFLTLLGILVGLAATAASGQGQLRWGAVVGLGALLAGLAVVRTVWSVHVVRRDGMPSIEVGPEELSLPAGGMSARVVRIKLERVHSAVLIGRGFAKRLVIDTGWRVFSFPAGQLAGPEAVARLQGVLQQRLAGLPDGGALRDAMARRHLLAESLGRVMPYACWGVVAVMVAAYGLQHVLSAADDPFALLDLGANAPVLVGAGQWYRLVSANFLHLTPRHLLGNALFLLVVGSMVERLTGRRHFLILLLTTAVVAQGVSAAFLPGVHLWSVGLSGGIFGLLGALGAIGWRFRADVPGGYRLQPWRWIMLTAIYAVAAPLLVPQIDSWGHAGGALAGLAMGALLCRGCPDAASLRRPVWLTNDAFAAVMLVVGLGLGAGVVHGMSRAGRDGDRLSMLLQAYHTPQLHPLLRNALAWQIAITQEAPPLLLRMADALEVQAERQLRKQTKKSPLMPALVDTEAVLNYRLGDPERAARLEAETPWLQEPLGSHLAFFLDGLVRERGMSVVGESGPDAPVITLSKGVMRLTQAVAAPHGARLYALLRGRDGLAGVLFFRLPPGFSGAQILPLPVSQGAPGVAAPAPVWTDGATRIEVALFDRRGCFCTWPSMGPSYAAYHPDPVLVP